MTATQRAVVDDLGNINVHGRSALELVWKVKDADGNLVNISASDLFFEIDTKLRIELTAGEDNYSRKLTLSRAQIATLPLNQPLQYALHDETPSSPATIWNGRITAYGFRSAPTGADPVDPGTASWSGATVTVQQGESVPTVVVTYQGATGLNPMEFLIEQGELESGATLQDYIDYLQEPVAEEAVTQVAAAVATSAAASGDLYVAIQAGIASVDAQGDTSVAAVAAQGVTSVAAVAAQEVTSTANVAATPGSDQYASTANALSKGVWSVAVTAGGSGGTTGTYYWTTTGGAGADAAGYLTVAGGAITAVVVTHRGQGYTSAPTIVIAGSHGVTGHTLTPAISQNQPAGTYFVVTVTNGFAVYQVDSGGATATLKVTVPLASDVVTALADIDDLQAYDAALDGSVLVYVVTKNLYNPADKVAGTYVGNGGGIDVAAGWGRTGYIPVTPGQSITVSANASKRGGLAFYASESGASYVSGSVNTSTTLPLTVTVPSGANFLAVNLYSTSIAEPSQVQIEVGASATTYEAWFAPVPRVLKTAIYPDIKEVVTSRVAAISSDTALGSSSIVFDVNGLSVNVTFSPAIALSHTQAKIFQYYRTAVDDVVQASSQTDDIAPYRMGGGTIGAAHGYNRTICNLTAHGKTAADLYSEWQDGSGNRWIIVLIDSSAAFSVTAKTGNGAFAGGALTHVSGATNTGSVTPSSVTAASLYPSITSNNLRLEVDGEPVEIDTTTYYPKSSVTFLESYGILNKDSMVAYLIANRAGADIPQPGGTVDVVVSNSYRFDDQGIVQTSDFLALQSVAAFQDIMFAQARILSEGTGNGDVKYYIPNALSFTQDAVTYDFANGQTMTSFAPMRHLFITSARSEIAPALLPDRVLQVNDVIGLAIGILPVQDAAPDVRRTNASRKALEIRYNSKKIYMSTIDRADKTSLTAGDYYSAVTYRRYFDPSEDRWLYTVPYGSSEYVYVHWYDMATTDGVPMPSRLAGRPFTVIDSHNATVKSGVIGASLQVAVSCTGSNAHVVLLVT